MVIAVMNRLMIIMVTGLTLICFSTVVIVTINTVISFLELIYLQKAEQENRIKRTDDEINESELQKTKGTSPYQL